MHDDDAEAVAPLLRAAYAKPGGGSISIGDGPMLPLTASRIRRWRQGAAAAWVAEVTGYGPVGAVFAVVEPEAAWMAGLGVAPDFRGAGVGAALTDHALEFLAASRRPLLGMEAAPQAVGAAGLYARRRFRPADITIRLRGAVTELRAAVDLKGWRESAGPDLPDHSYDNKPALAARIQSQPHSSASFVLSGPDVVLLCDPDPLIPGPGGSLDLRLVAVGARALGGAGTWVGAAARSASARGLSSLDVDLSLADGHLLRRLQSLGLTPIASTVRLVNDQEDYVAWRTRNGPVGRWSF
jgi:ribosomal protein S18 acetylase RimI-like enzyme